MSNPTYVKLTGWVTKDPELRKTNGDQTAVCTIRVGTANRWPDRATGEWREGPASYFDVVCWRSLAWNVSASVRKGHMITIHGTFRNRAWIDKDNNPRTSLEITANSVGHELMYGWSHFNRTHRPSDEAAEALAKGEASRGLEAAQGEGAPGPEWGQRDDDRFRVGDGQGDPDPSAEPAYEPAAERIYDAGDGGDDADAAESVTDEPRLEEAAVPA